MVWENGSKDFTENFEWGKGMTVIEVGADLFESAFYVISQKVSYTWSQFADMLKVYPLARPRIYVSIYG